MRPTAIGSWQLAKPKKQGRSAESAKIGQMERKLGTTEDRGGKRFSATDLH
jgi:hypothetical protein